MEVVVIWSKSTLLLQDEEIVCNYSSMAASDSCCTNDRAVGSASRQLLIMTAAYNIMNEAVNKERDLCKTSL